MANTTRPDILNAVREVARRARDQSMTHGRAVAKIFQYINSTRDMGLVRRKAGRCRLETFADASHAEDMNDRRSVSGMVTSFSGGAPSWSSKTEACVTLTPAEPEKVELADRAKDVIFSRMLPEFQHPELPKLRIRISEGN